MKQLQQDDLSRIDQKISGKWKFGIFYFNPKDKNIIVPMLNPKMGWTLNFAHPITYFILLLLIVAILIFTYFRR